MKLQFQRFVAIWLFLAMAFSAPAFAAWPFSNKKTVQTSSPAPSSSKTQAVSSNSSKSTASTEETFFDEEGESEEVPALPQIPQVPKVNTGIPQLPQVKYPAFSQKTGVPSSAPVSSASVDPDIARIQKQIQEIMKINESLKTNFSGQAAEIQKISDQAKIHGEILKDLDSSKKIAEEAGADKYLNKEKLRLIREETEKNQKYLQELNDQKETAAANTGKSSSLIPVDSAKKV